MIINNKSIRGIFVYTPEAVFERADYVIEGIYIYICEADRVSGFKPSENPDKFSLYVGGELATLEDFTKYALQGDSDSGNKLVSAYLLGQILNTYQSGYNESGIITNSVAADGEIFMSEYFGIDTGHNITGTKYLDPLKEIMIQPGLNSAVFTVHREIASRIFGQFSKDNLATVILRQYTYKEQGVDNRYIRVQEIVDQETGSTKFRYLVVDDQDYSGVVSAWVSTNVSEGVADQVDAIVNYYIAENERLRSKEAGLQNMFRFAELGISSNGLDVDIAGLDDSDYVTVCLYKNDNVSGSTIIRSNETLTIPLSDFVDSSTRVYQVFSAYRATINRSPSKLTFTFTSSSTQGASVRVGNAYYRQSYPDYQQWLSQN